MELKDRLIRIDTLNRYVRKLRIDFFAVPANIGGEIHALLVKPDRLAYVALKFPELMEFQNNELFPRWGRVLTPTKVVAACKPFAKIPTGVSVEDFKQVKAMEWEHIVCDSLNLFDESAVHVGDNLHDVDVIDRFYGRIECKKGRGKIGEYA